MNISFWLGLLAVGGVLFWGVSEFRSMGNLFNLHGLTVVFGGTFAATLINCPFRILGNAFLRLFLLFVFSRLPTPEEVIAEMSRLSRVAQTQGGLLSLQEQSRGFAGGFLSRAINIAIAVSESAEIRRLVESEIKQTRIEAQENANVFRTMGVLSPMFGLMGTLLGMIRVLESISEPTKVGPAMAMALSSAFMGIGFANVVCIPISGRMRLQAMNETLVLEMILEGVLDIARGKAPYLVELHLAAYSRRRRRELEAETTATRPAAETAA